MSTPVATPANTGALDAQNEPDRRNRLSNLKNPTFLGIFTDLSSLGPYGQAATAGHITARHGACDEPEQANERATASNGVGPETINATATKEIIMKRFINNTKLAAGSFPTTLKKALLPAIALGILLLAGCLLYTSPSPRDRG